MHSNTRGLAFLLSIGSLPIACAKDDNNPGASETDPTTNGMTGTSTGLGNSTTDEPTGAPTTTPGETGDTTTTGATTTGAETTESPVTTFLTTNTTSGTTAVDTEGLPPVTDPECLAYAAKIVECFPRYSDYRQYLGYYCEYAKKYGLAGDGQACLDAFEAQFVCVTNTDCADFPEDGPPCPAEQAASMAACPNFFEPIGSTDTDGDTSGGTSG